ncbi:hypothetical protein [Herbiconiux sp. L3-i23]|uniref:hypothetical protein n=1 Tax=Herbiconiux sp. L3-i23 TaxID=2905871 RepID=UPI0020608867|nr:hypothetical protein [Herbiconiux sp. L3-i23]BDI22457.1 hypothetical protein L3i23_12330 [Herbiconiux sp. L3-i23]
MRRLSVGATVGATIGGILAGTLLLSGCAAGGAGPDASPSPSAIGPVIVTVDGALAGTTVTLPMGRVLDLDAETPDAWSATFSDPAIAEFTPGGTKDGATFNPGITPLEAGSTEVSLTDGTDEIAFTLQVTE